MKKGKQFLLDTQILIWLMRNETTKLKNKRLRFLDENCFVSIESLKEMAHKLAIGKIEIEANPKRLLKQIENFGISVLDFDKDAISALFNLPFYKENRDPSDRAIVAHAISKKMVLVSEDSQFRLYQKDGLYLQRLK